MLMRRLAIVITAVAFALLVVAAPRPARANSFTDPLILSGMIAGGVAVVLLLSIALADRTPDTEELMPRSNAPLTRAPLPWGSRTCPPSADGTLPLVCW